NGVLQEDGGWGFRHELLRRSVLSGMIEADRRDAHRAFAEALERAEPRAAELAMHFGLAGDPRAAYWATQAARQYSAADAHVEALAELERALESLNEPEERRRAMRSAAAETWL